MLRKEGKFVQEATNFLNGMTVGEKNELLFENGINFNDIPNWQKRGVGLYWETYRKPCINPKNGSEAMADRRRIKVDYDLPMKEEYSRFISNFMNNDKSKEV